MYKSKVQELCHERKWGGPKYSCMKDGPDHNPQFKASVSLNGMLFHTTTTLFKSSKAAHNEAAKLAFLHFTTPCPDVNTLAGRSEIEETDESPKVYSNASIVKPDSSTPNTDPVADERPKVEDSHHGVETNPGTLNFMSGMGGYQYKRNLQSYAQRKNIDSPLYSVKREGPPHALCFKATVTVHGCSFESPGHYNTLKEAEHAAAKFALKSLSVDSFQENDSGYYKNLLQELAQNQGFILPTYETTKSGPPHKPRFFSIVEVEGETFHGIPGPSKKQAEINAAKVAYTVFMERKSNGNGEFMSSGFSEDETPDLNLSADSLATVDDRQQTITNGDPAVSFSVLKLEERGKEDSEVKMKSMMGTSSYLLCSRVKVYTSIPDGVFPWGTLVLPISENKWVVVSLEFPKEKSI